MFDKILLPIDINEPESWAKALPMALRCAGSNGSIHVLGILHELGSAMVASFLPEGFEEKALVRLKQELNDFVAREIPDGISAQSIVGHGHVPETILKTAGKIGADLIVMASQSPNDHRTLLVASNATKVVRHAEIPVLVVR